MTEQTAVLRFWFEELEPADWWRKDPGLDGLIAERFAPIWQRARVGECAPWRATAAGRLAEVLVLDQFSRNIHRDTPEAFAQDPLALVLAQEAVAAGADARLTEAERGFLYMPFMHSESLQVHLSAEPLFRACNDRKMYEFELQHRAIIERFGRYPHRNAILGRISTPRELAFLEQPGSSF